MVKKTIWKYLISIKDYQTIEMPVDAEILSFKLQYGIPVLWALVETSKEVSKRRFRLVGTGHDIIEDGLKYIGTVNMLDDKIIYHLFEY